MGDLQPLATRVSHHQPGAAAELRRELEIQMVRIVRQVVRTGVGNSALARRILAEARQASLDSLNARATEGEERVLSVARRVCDSVMHELRSGSAGGDHRMRDTVLV